MLRLLCVVVASASLAIAQLDSNSVTVSVSRSLYAVADRVSINVDVATRAGSSFDDALSILKRQGSPTPTLLGVYSNQDTLTWTFQIQAPLENVGNIIGSLWGQPFRLSVNGLSLSDAAASQIKCNYADLITQAQAQARQLTDAAGLRLGPILAVADIPAFGDVIPSVVGDVISSRTGDFVFASLLLGVSPWFDVTGFATTPVQTCSITAKYQLLRN